MKNLERADSCAWIRAPAIKVNIHIIDYTPWV